MRNPFKDTNAKQQSNAKPQSIASAVADGQQMLADEPTGPTKPAAKKGGSFTNLYQKAWEQVLSTKSISAQVILEKMARGDLARDRRYDEFVKEVIRLGDQLSA